MDGRRVPHFLRLEVRMSEDRRLKVCVERMSGWGQGVMRDAFGA